ncbi:MAG: hypothetical protein WC310_02365 [Patescibacteria group bacterium]|jgi:hypothetical protein
MIYLFWAMTILMVLGVVLTKRQIKKQYSAGGFIHGLTRLVEAANYERALQLCMAKNDNDVLAQTCRKMLVVIAAKENPAQIEMYYQEGSLWLRETYKTADKKMSIIGLIQSVIFFAASVMLTAATYFSGATGWMVAIPATILFAAEIAAVSLAIVIKAQGLEKIMMLAKFRTTVYKTIGYYPPECSPEPIESKNKEAEAN